MTMVSANKSSEARRRIPEVNPATGLSTDYLNHFSEAMMVLEMLPQMPECLDEFLAWQPKTYREHFGQSGFTDTPHVLACYDGADPQLRHSLETLSEIMNTMLLATRAALAANGPGETSSVLAQNAVRALRTLIGRTAAMINGQAPALYENRESVDTDVDAMFAR